MNGVRTCNKTITNRVHNVFFVILFVNDYLTNKRRKNIEAPYVRKKITAPFLALTANINIFCVISRLFCVRAIIIVRFVVWETRVRHVAINVHQNKKGTARRKISRRHVSFVNTYTHTTFSYAPV